VSQGEPLASLWTTFFLVPITTNPLVIFLHGWRALFLFRNATFLKKCHGGRPKSEVMLNLLLLDFDGR